MNRRIAVLANLLVFITGITASGFEKIPSGWKWLGDREVAFTYDGTYASDRDFVIDVSKKYKQKPAVHQGQHTPSAFVPEHSVNAVLSPDASKLAFTRFNDLYVVDLATKKETRLTYDGSDVILNGYASWVYYEEIFGRKSRYKAFWWSPDSKKIGFYRFDNSRVPVFPIYSPKGRAGVLLQTRYPKAGDSNPGVKIYVSDVDTGKKVQMDFDENEDVYYGTPFWSADSKHLYVGKMPRVQNKLELYSCDADNGTRKLIHVEHHSTWVDWIEDIHFGRKGMYFVRDFYDGWAQIYFLSYDGSEFRQLTSGENRRTKILKVEEQKGEIFYTAERGDAVNSSLFKLSGNGKICLLTESGLHVEKVVLSPDCRYAVASVSNYSTPSKIRIYDFKNKKSTLIADSAPENFSLKEYPHFNLVKIKNKDGLDMYAAIMYPAGFDPGKKYPVYMNIYGGPDTPLVKDRWQNPSSLCSWNYNNGIIQVTADCRAAGHNGRKGIDFVYENLTKYEQEDFVEWAKYLQALPYVDADKICVEGFSFGGTMASLLVMKYPSCFHYGIAGGGVYDWMFYDSHYTERYMNTPANNPEGYKNASVLNQVRFYVPDYENDRDDVMLLLTHGTGDDNVHFQNTLRLVDELQKNGKKFELMIYPDGMHGYGGYLGVHFDKIKKDFIERYLLKRRTEK